MQNIAILFTLLLSPHWALTLANVPEALRGRIGVALAFVFSSVGHFIKTSAMTRMLPSWVPITVRQYQSCHCVPFAGRSNPISERLGHRPLNRLTGIGRVPTSYDS